MNRNHAIWHPVVLHQCCWCHAIQDGDGDAIWVRVERMPLLGNAKHGVCPECSAGLIQETRQLQAVPA